MTEDEIDLLPDDVDVDDTQETTDDSYSQTQGYDNLTGYYNDQETDTSGTGVSPENQNGTISDPVMDAYLRFNGIQDPSRIKFEGTDGIMRERSWEELSPSEQLNLLTTSQAQPERDLDDNEIALLNEIRSRNITPQQYINAIQQQAAQDYQDQAAANPQYQVADLTDDELFILDLQDKVEDATDEEIAQALMKAKEDPLFEKKMAGVRRDLQAQEQMYNEQLQAQQQAVAEQNFADFRDAVIDGIQSFNKVGDLDVSLEPEDQEDIAAFILDRDETGMSYLGKALNDPKTLVELSWWALKGRSAFRDIQDYFINEIKNVRQESYQKGLFDGRNGTSKVVMRPQNTNTYNAGRQVVSQDDIWG